MRACFADNADLPITCANDIGQPWDCIYADAGLQKENCVNWQPERATRLAKDILGEME